MKNLPKSLILKIFIIGIVLLFTIGLSKWIGSVPLIKSGDKRITINDHSETLNFIVIGDTGTGEADQGKVATAMEAYCQSTNGKIDGILLLGDNIYMDGAKSADDPQWETKVETPYNKPCLSQIPMYPVLGNHDYRNSPGSQIEYSAKNPRWKFPYRFYSVTWSDLLTLVAFDSGFPDFCFLSEYCTVDFMRAELKSSNSKWKIVTAHHPLATSSTKGHSHSGGSFGFFMKPFVCGSANLWMSGHSHHLEHRQEPGCDTELFVSGAGGAKLNDVHTDQPEAKFAAKAFGFLILEINRNQLKTQFIGLENQVLYEYSL